MARKSLKQKYSLLVVAHPDDETIFFAGLLQLYRKRPWRVICVTDANADGQGPKRRQDFKEACRRLKVKDCEMWELPDRFDQRLSVDELVKRLGTETPSEVFTHGPLGEYGHPHHQDVSLAVHRTFYDKVPVWSCAYNAYAIKNIRLSKKAFELKAKILSEVYFSETHRFTRWLPLTRAEGFLKVTLSEVESLHAYFSSASETTKLNPKALKCYGWFAPYLEVFKKQVRERAF